MTVDQALTIILRQEVRAMFGSRSAILSSTLVLASVRGMTLEDAILECQRITRLYLDSRRGDEVGTRLRQIVHKHSGVKQ